MRELLQCTNLASLNNINFDLVNLLCNDDLGDPALTALANLPVLHEIYLGPAQITTAGLSYFIQQRCSTLTFLVSHLYQFKALILLFRFWNIVRI